MEALKTFRITNINFDIGTIPVKCASGLTVSAMLIMLTNSSATATNIAVFPRSSSLIEIILI